MVPFPAPAVSPGSAPGMRERELLAAWREGHWALQERLRELPAPDQHDVDALYQVARRADTDLTSLYQRRAEALARQVRDLLLQRNEAAPVAAPAASAPGEDAETALLAWFRSMSREDRAALIALAERFARR